MIEKLLLAFKDLKHDLSTLRCSPLIMHLLETICFFFRCNPDIAKVSGRLFEVHTALKSQKTNLLWTIYRPHLAFIQISIYISLKKRDYDYVCSF